MQAMLNVAVRAARAGGDVISRASADLEAVKISRKAMNDFVTEVDHDSENAIIDALLQAYPTHGIWAEESGREHGNPNSDFQWIIDPLDGTTNFIHGLPIYCVSIAVAHKGQIQHAVVYDPCRNDLFTASKGAGAFLNNRRMRVSKRLRLADSLVGTGFPFRKGDDFDKYIELFKLLMQSTQGIRRPGAAALDLAYVAAGYYEAFYETGLKPWDMAAGSLLITEAGGLVGNFRGEADFLERGEVVAGTPKVYGELVKLLTPFSEVPALEVAPRKAITPKVKPIDLDAAERKLMTPRFDGYGGSGKEPSMAKQRLQARRVKKAVDAVPIPLPEEDEDERR
jgi:myo-inositol-1(or 4)-monophosphatase